MLLFIFKPLIVLNLHLSGVCDHLVVDKADYAACNGHYYRDSTLKASWAPEKPVYRRSDSYRYIFYNNEHTYNNGWAIGPVGGFARGGYFHYST